MRIQRSTGWKASLVFASILVTAFVAGAQTSAVAPRITQAIDETNLVTLKGNTLPMARAEFDQGLVSDSLPLEKMLLVLQRSPAQESALRSLLDQQQDKTSPNYHKWLTPEQFGQRFGVADADIQTVTNWLQGHGFTIESVTKGKTLIEFTGTAGLVRNAFHTDIHNYLVNGEKHIANSSNPQIPAALVPVVAGVASLHDFFPKPHYIQTGKTVTATLHSGSPVAHLTGGPGEYFVGPLDFAEIYNIAPLYTAGTTGSGRTIAVLGVTDIVTSDVSLFDSVFGLTPHLNVIHTGTDPGDLEGSDRVEATLDVEWSGAIGQGATIDLVVSKTTSTSFGTDLSAIYVEENNLADVMTVSYGACEAEFTVTQAEAESQLGEQAAAQGITYMAASGDAGAEDCATSETSPADGAADFGVDLPGATPFVVSVGGTEFNEGSNDNLYWSTSTSADETALSYIPENVWNDSCTSGVGFCGTGETIVGAGGGGASVYFNKPSWQTGFSGTPSDSARDVPDVAFTASPYHDPLIICVTAPADSCSESGDTVYLPTIGGTSVSTPSFAGIMSIVDQYTSSRQGDADYVLYKLAATETFSSCNGSGTPALSLTGSCIFNDTTAGNNAVPGEVSYNTANPLYVAGTGYDKAAGLGSTNVENLAKKWTSVSFNSTTTTMTGVPTTATTGQSITAAITVTSGAGTPTGDVSVIATAAGCPSVGVPFVTLSGGAASSSFSLGGAGTYSIVAHYAGDGNFGASDSAPSSVTVTGTACSSTGGSRTFSAASSPTSASISSPGGSSSSTITVTGASFTGTVTLTCSVTPTKSTDSDIPSCSFNSPATSSVGLSLSPGSETQTATLNVATTEASGTFIPSSPSSQHPMHTVWIAASIELALACLFLLTAPAQKKRWGLLFAVGVLAVVAGAVGCGSSGGSSGGGGGGGNPGTTPDSYTITVSAGSGGTTETATFTVTVQ
ncbi:MAG: protease pro-enzyme activation domain-containing protein [Candidatus Acidiferrales bacterium]